MLPPNLVGFFKSKKVSTWFVFNRLRFHLLEQKKKKNMAVQVTLEHQGIGGDDPLGIQLTFSLLFTWLLHIPFLGFYQPQTTWHCII